MINIVKELKDKEMYLNIRHDKKYNMDISDILNIFLNN
jgi:hypothetical protein